MKLGTHLAVSGAAGAVIWAASGDPETLGLAIAAGTLPDSDHVFDYWNWYVRKNTEKLFILFHGWEYLAAAIALYLLVWTEPWMLAITIGYATQIGTDQYFNGVRWRTYFFVLRAADRFRWQSAKRDRPADTAYKALVHSLPFFREPMLRWFEARKPRDTDVPGHGEHQGNVDDPNATNAADNPDGSPE